MIKYLLLPAGASELSSRENRQILDTKKESEWRINL